METIEQLFGGALMSLVPDPYAVYRQLRRDLPVRLVDMGFSRQRSAAIGP